MHTYRVYIHTKLDTNEPFYIGRASTSWRPNQKTRRNSYWNSVATKHDFTVRVIGGSWSREYASKVEQRLISLYSRKHKLTNLTAGGDGCVGMIHTDKAKKAMSVARKGKSHSPEWSRKISESHRQLKGKRVIGVSSIGPTLVFNVISDVSLQGFTPSNVRSCLSGCKLTHKGYSWSYA